jgi:hypothetical protein
MVMLLAVTAVSAQLVGPASQHGGTYGRETYREPQVVIVGYLIDSKCATSHLTALSAIAMDHQTECALKQLNGGLGFVAEGQWFAFDEKGSKKAGEVLKKSKTSKGLMVSVTGTMHGDRFAFTKIKEIKHDS